eukprot:TRINITY_DN1816_c0_g1_i1.p1 TRINITY_DN1816_c0_g1~~TRINITY_DN1816_c0_g1_i1.p1  ORF type:complete len:1106 (+),score=234.48 TRINITY_DN1816_c0_g1_i1:12-3329(+)
MRIRPIKYLLIITVLVGVVLLLSSFRLFSSTGNISELNNDVKQDVPTDTKQEVVITEPKIETEIPTSPEYFPPKLSVKERLEKGRYDNETHVLHMVSHSHWDREWYLSFEQFRRSLVLSLDKVFELIADDPDFYHWHNDGQTVILEDYLEIRPHMSKLIEEAARKGYISLGPWYTQPDEFLVSGESLIRNLWYGIQSAKKLSPRSEPLRVGYLPDTFGHVSQMPQILSGFDINVAMIARGYYRSGIHTPTETYWSSPDNTKILLLYLSSNYCNGLFHERMSSNHNDTQVIAWFLLKHEKVLTDHSEMNHALLLNGCDHSHPDYDVGEVVNRADNLLSESKNIRILHSTLPDFVEYAKENIANIPNVEEYHGELLKGEDVTTQLINVLSNQIRQKQDNWRGQTLLEKFTEPITTISWLLAKHRYDHEMIDYSWKLLLKNHAHDSIAGCSVTSVHLDVDSRFRQSREVADAVLAESYYQLVSKINYGEDVYFPKVVVYNPLPVARTNELIVMNVDFNQTTSLYGKEIIVVDSDGNESPVVVITRNAEWDYILPKKGFRKGFRSNTRYLIAFMANNIPSVGYNTYTIKVNKDKKSYYDVDYEKSTLYLKNPDSESGSRVAASRKSADEYGGGESYENFDFTEPFHGIFDEKKPSSTTSSKNSRNKKTKKDYVLENFEISNEYWTLQMNKLNGGFSLINKIVSPLLAPPDVTSIWKNINILNFCAERGTEYVSIPSTCTQTSKDMIEKVKKQTSFLYETLEITIKRTDNLYLNVSYLLAKGSQKVDVRVSVANYEHNHLIKAIFGKSDYSGKVYVDGHFDIVDISIDNYNYHNQQQFLIKEGEDSGIVVANRGIPEVDQSGSLSITLLRAVGRLGDWGEFPTPLSQQQGLVQLEYSIIPFFKNINDNHPVDILSKESAIWEARKFNAPVLPLQIYDPFVLIRSSPICDLSSTTLFQIFKSIDDDAQYLSGGHTNLEVGSLLPPIPNKKDNYLPPKLSIIPQLDSSSKLELTALKQSSLNQNSFIFRYYNPTEHHIDDTILLNMVDPVQSVYLCNLEEIRIQKLDEQKIHSSNNNNLEKQQKHSGLYKYSVGISVPPKRIHTIEVELLKQ